MKAYLFCISTLLTTVVHCAKPDLISIAPCTSQDLIPINLLLTMCTLPLFCEKDFLEKKCLAAHTEQTNFSTKKLVGVIIFEQRMSGSTLFVNQLATNKGYRRQGIGNRLIQEAQERMPCVHVQFNSYAEALAFYQRIGFNCRPYSAGTIVTSCFKMCQNSSTISFKSKV